MAWTNPQTTESAPFHTVHNLSQRLLYFSGTMKMHILKSSFKHRNTDRQDKILIIIILDDLVR